MTAGSSILSRAAELGFAASGIARVGLSETFDSYHAWIAESQAGNMTYLARNAEVRIDPRRILPDARSLIAVAARYPVNPEPGHGFSSYARGADYHDVLRKRLRGLGKYVQQETGCSSARICVDTAPLLEREWAVRAGIGWRGKQGQLVNNRLGCCLCLGFLLVNAELDESPAAKNQCGDCELCVQSCPTGAIRGDATLSPERCLSYLTIEHRGPIPEEHRAAMGETLFGCDCCTAVCPWNRLGADKILPEFQGDEAPTAAEILRMDEAAFEERFRNTVVFRTGLERLKRNARVAAGNSGAGESGGANRN